MAAFTAIRRHKGSFVHRESSFPREFTELMDPNDWLGNYDIEMLMLDGTWQKRRVVWSNVVLQFSKIGQLQLIDKIPMHEVISISKMTRVTFDGFQKCELTKPVEDKSENMHDSSSNFFKATKFVRDFGVRPSVRRGSVNKIENTLQIKTVPDGHNSGRTYYCRLESEQLCEDVMLKLNVLAKAARKRAAVHSRFERIQTRVRKFSESAIFQIFSALLIVLNFISNAAESQLSDVLIESDGSPSHTADVLEILDRFFTIIFTVELSVNAFAHWCSPFFSDGWNLFDLVVVSLSLAALGPLRIPVTVVRSLRAFRVLRIIGRFKGLKNIVSGVASSVMPVIQALLILVIVTSIYSILGTTFFGDLAPNTFAKFDQALVALFRVTAGMGWIDGLSPTSEDGSVNWGVSVFMMSYVVVANWTLLQVCVAILLDCFITAKSDALVEEDQALLQKAADQNLFINAMDPLLEVLTIHHDDDADLSTRILNLFKALDTDDSKMLSYDHLAAGLKKLELRPRIHLSESDFAVLTGGGALCGPQASLGPGQFEAAVRRQLTFYAQRQLSSALIIGTGTRAEFVQMGTLKTLLRQQVGLVEALARRDAQDAAALRTLSSLQEDLALLRAHVFACPAPRRPASCPTRRSPGLRPSPGEASLCPVQGGPQMPQPAAADDDEEEEGKKGRGEAGPDGEAACGVGEGPRRVGLEERAARALAALREAAAKEAAAKEAAAERRPTEVSVSPQECAGDLSARAAPPSASPAPRRPSLAQGASPRTPARHPSQSLPQSAPQAPPVACWQLPRGQSPPPDSASAHPGPLGPAGAPAASGRSSTPGRRPPVRPAPWLPRPADRPASARPASARRRLTPTPASARPVEDAGGGTAWSRRAAAATPPRNAVRFASPDPPAVGGEALGKQTDPPLPDGRADGGPLASAALRGAGGGE